MTAYAHRWPVTDPDVPSEDLFALALGDLRHVMRARGWRMTAVDLRLVVVPVVYGSESGWDVVAVCEVVRATGLAGVELGGPLAPDSRANHEEKTQR